MSRRGRSTQGCDSRAVIRRKWSPVLYRLKGYASAEAFREAEDECFACCRAMPVLERAHIIPRRHGGKANWANIHILCDRCHTESEDLTGTEYWDWFWSRHFSHRMTLLEAIA